MYRLHTYMVIQHQVIPQCNCQLYPTWLMSLKSWLTKITPPSKSLIASARESMVSMSRWLVGSSRSKRWGQRNANHAKTTRQRWPSDRFLMGQTYVHTWCARGGTTLMYHVPCAAKSRDSCSCMHAHIHSCTHTYLLLPGEAVASKDPPHLLFFLLLRVAFHHVRQGRLVQWQVVLQVLRII